MDTKDKAQRPAAPARKLLIGVAVAIGVFAGITLSQRSRNDPAAAIDRLAGDPNFGAAFTVFQRDFPADYAAFKAQMTTTAATASSPEAAYAQSMAFMQRWVASKQPLIRKADGEAVAALISEQGRTLRHLRTTDVRECAEFGMNGRLASPDMKDTTLRNLAAAGMERTLLAIKSGERAGPAPPEAMTEADHQIFLAALNRRVSDQAKFAMLTSGQLTSAGPQVQCDVTIAMTEAVGDLPQPLRGKVARSILIG